MLLQPEAWPVHLVYVSLTGPSTLRQTLMARASSLNFAGFGNWLCGTMEVS